MADPVRILTWNLWGRFGPWEQRQPAIAAVLAEVDADVVCLQEVWSTEDADQMATLAELLGAHAVRSPDPDHHRMSNAVLSRWPIETQEWHYLPSAQGPAHRTVLHAGIAAPFGRLDVFTTHLVHHFDAGDLRCRQAAAVARFVSDHRGDPESAFPPVLTGDLNAVPDSDEIRQLKGLRAPAVPNLVFHDAWEQAGDGGDGVTWSSENPHQDGSTWPDRRLDYVLVGWPRPKPVGNPIRCRLIGTDPVDGVVPSDHYGVLAELRVESDSG